MKEFFLKRYKNYGFWIALTSVTLLFANEIFKYFGVVIDNNGAMEIVKAGLGIAVILGVVNDPTTDNKGFGDDK